MSVHLVKDALEAAGARYAVIGGRAVAARGYPRVTFDTDFFTGDRKVFERSMWDTVAAAGATLDIRRGDYDDPLGGVVHITFPDGTDVDVVVAKWKWEAEVIDRAESMMVAGMVAPVPRTSDLILLKLAAGGYRDLSDVHGLLSTAPRHDLIAQVEQHLARLQPDAQAEWRRIVDSTATSG